MEPEVNTEILRYVRYLSFKGDCLREQQENPLKIDREKAQKHFEELEAVVQEKLVELIAAMPKVPVEHTAPKIYKKKDGTLSAHGVKWEAKLKEYDQPSGTLRFFEYINGNPNGPQLKEYLFSLGWEPCTYKFVRDKLTGDERQIPQIRYFSANDPRKGELTDSVKSLIEREPSLEALDGLTMSQHRMNIFKAFLENSDENGICVAGAGGFTNTLRFKHRNPFVNLPKADGEVPWGVEIRSCIIAPEGYEMCGSDVVSLEASTKRHYMYPHDPEYADAMGADGFDEHLDLSVHAGALTQEEIDEKGPKHPEIKSVRKQYKATNYSAIYGVGPPKLARELFIKLTKAKALLKAYWDRNWAIKKVAEGQYVKTLKDGSLWLKNPVSGFYYSLRYEKDIFSTLNQGTGVYIFDHWLMRVRRKGVVVSGQMHDEVFYPLLKGNQPENSRKLNEAMEEVNQSLGLNVTVKVDIQYGENYGQVH